MTELAPGGNESGNHTTRPHHRYTYQKGTKMRKLGILIATLAVTALTVVGFAASPAQAEGHEETLCPAVDGVTGAVVDGGVPLDDTAAGGTESCVQSGLPLAGNGLVLDPLLCGLEKDITEEIHEGLGGAVGSVHGGLDDAEDALEEGGLPENIVGFDHPCKAEPTDKKITPKPDPGNGGGGAEVAPQVLANNAAGDGGMPRTGGELFAGAGFALASVGALIRRFVG